MKKHYMIILLLGFAASSPLVGSQKQVKREAPDLLDIMPKELWGIVQGYSDFFIPGPVFKKHGSSPIVAVSFSFDGKRVVSTSEDGAAYIWDVKTGALVQTLKTRGALRRMLSSSEEYFCSAEFSADGNTIITESLPSNEVSLWDARTGALLRTVPTMKNRYYPRLRRKPQFNADGTQFLITTDHSVMIQNINGANGDYKTRLLPYSGQEDRVFWAQFTPVPFTVAVFGNDAQWMFSDLWNIATNERIMRIRPNNDHIYTSSLFNRDGTRMALVGSCVISIFDLTTGKSYRRIIPTIGPEKLMVLAIDNDLNRALIYARDNDNTIQVYDIAADRVVLTLAGHTGKINSAHFSPHDPIIMTAGQDYTIRIWDDKTGAELQQLPGSDALFNRDGAVFIGWDEQGSDSNLYLWARSPLISAKQPQAALVGAPEEKKRAADATEDPALQKQRDALRKTLETFRKDNEAILTDQQKVLIGDLLLKLPRFQQWQLNNTKSFLESMQKNLRAQSILAKLQQATPSARRPEDQKRIIERILGLLERGQSDDAIIALLKDELMKTKHAQ